MAKASASRKLYNHACVIGDKSASIPGLSSLASSHMVIAPKTFAIEILRELHEYLSSICANTAGQRSRNIHPCRWEDKHE